MLSIINSMVQVEVHDGTSYQVQAEMVYNGMGQRLSLTAYQGEQSLSTSYLLDRNTLLAATAAGQSTFYLAGIAENEAAWSYYLSDGTNSVWQLSDTQGQVTLARSFTSWGELLDQSGQGDFTWGYLGGALDAATGLIYLGNGQYYDPATGRFLSRGVNPAAPNPYVPWQGDPLGMIVGPLALLAMVRGKRKAGKADQFLVVLLSVMVTGLIVSGCSQANISTPSSTTTSQPSTPTATGKQEPKPTTTVTKEPTRTTTPTQSPTDTPKLPEKCGPDTEIDIRVEGLGYYGKKIYALYQAMIKATDAWWYIYNDGKFTWEQFNGLLLMHEGAGAGIMADLVALAAAQNLFIGGHNPPYCTDECNCFVGVFRFWATYSQSIKSLADTFENLDIRRYKGYGGFADLELLQKIQGVIAQNMERAQELGNEMLHPTSLIGDKDTGPANWGNVEEKWTNALKLVKGLDEGKIGSIEDDKVYYYNGSFVVYSVNQRNYWEKILGPIKLKELN